ncbi:hypothetical protein BVC93_16545 [Mycobacterium sp. MS1601]|nr:hypothetical protein BVC93_16545 [Mycobacterium sp. MS1601]
MPSAQTTASTRAEIRRVTAAGTTANALEYYDFFLYGTAAALVFNVLFFPDLSPMIGTIAAFGTWGVGFIARPFGSIFFGHFGDRLGRKNVLIVTLVTMGSATTLIGVLPTYDTAGIWAPILLVTMRFIQGFAVGGEWGGTTSLIAEHSPNSQRGFYTGLSQSGVSSGFVLSAGVVALVTMLPDEALLSWGWRIPFLLSIALLAIGLYIRLQVSESPLFQEAQTAHDRRPQKSSPVFQAIRYNPRSMFVAIGARVGETSGAYMIQTFVLVYATTTLGLDRSTLLWILVLAVTIELATIPIFGSLSDRVGRRPVYLIGAGCLGLFAFPLFVLINTESLLWITIALIIGMALCHGAMVGAQAAYFAELFDTGSRYSGAALGNSIGGSLAGGLTPIVSLTLLEVTGTVWAVAALLCGLALITVLAIVLGPETRGRVLSEPLRPHHGVASSEDPQPGPRL